MEWDVSGPKMVVFDFDGTLAETREAVSSTLNAALHDADLPRVHPPYIHGLMGLPLDQLVRKLVPRIYDHVDIPALVRWYRDHFDEIGAPLVEPMPDADAVLELGLPLGIATSREWSSLEPLLARFGWAERFSRIGTCDRVERGKPHPDVLLYALDGVEPSSAVFVGDTTWDVEVAKAAGATSVAMPTGSHTHERLEASEPDVVLASLTELPGWIRAAHEGGRW